MKTNFNDFNMNEETKKVYKPVVRQQEAEHYVSTSDLIAFISQNAPMDWNECCDYVYKSHILSHEENDLYDYDIIKHPENYNADRLFLFLKHTLGLRE